MACAFGFIGMPGSTHFEGRMLRRGDTAMLTRTQAGMGRSFRARRRGIGNELGRNDSYTLHLVAAAVRRPLIGAHSFAGPRRASP